MHSIRVILKIHVDGIQTFFRNMFGFLCTSEIMSPYITYLMSHVMPVIKAHAAETAATMNVQEEEDSVGGLINSDLGELAALMSQNIFALDKSGVVCILVCPD